MSQDRFIILSFDVEEFDLPLEYGLEIPVEEQLATGYAGLKKVEGLLNDASVRTTLYTTAFFAENFAGAIKSLSGHHEIASHTYYHGNFKEQDLLNSRLRLEDITGKSIQGLRMPRMMSVDTAAVASAGYRYNSSINPTWVPGRYNNLSAKKKISYNGKIFILPLSVSPHLRIPLFWLAFKNLPYKIFLKLALTTLKYEGYIHLYFHPWEFTNLQKYRFPTYLKRQDNDVLLNKLQRLIADLSNEGIFIDTAGFVDVHREHLL